MMDWPWSGNMPRAARPAGIGAGGTLGARLEGARAGAVGGTGTGSRRSSSRKTGLDVVSMSRVVRAERRAGAAAAALDLGRHDHRGVDHRGRHDHRQLEPTVRPAKWAEIGRAHV